MSGDVISTAAAAVATLYAPGAAEAERRRADDWLKALMPTQDAWGVANAFLSASPAPGDAVGEQRVFFGAVLFLDKLHKDFEQLPAASLGALKAALMDAMRRFAAGAGSPALRPALRKLCIAYADFLLQAPGASPGAMIGELVGAFTPGSPGGAFVLLEVLCALPEEAQSLPRLQGARRGVLLGELAKIGKDVLELLGSLLRHAAGGSDIPAMNATFDALGAWLSNVGIPQEDVAGAPVVAHLVDAAVQHEPLFAKATGALHELVEFFDARRRRQGGPPCRELAALIVASVGKLLPLWNAKRAAYDAAVAARDEEAEERALEAAEALSRLFSDAAYAFLVTLLGRGGPATVPGAPAAWEAEVAQWLQLLCTPVAHPAMSVVEPTFRTWRKLADCVAEQRRAGGEGSGGGGGAGAGAGAGVGAGAGAGMSPYTDAAHAARVSAALAAPLLTLVPVWVARLAFPPNAAWRAWTADRVDLFKHDFRYDCQDALLLVADVAGGEATLRALGAQLQAELARWAGAGPAAQEAGADGWQGVEATLYAVRSVARHVAASESVVLPGVFQLLLGRALPLRTSPELRATAFRLIGRYAKWLAAQPPAVHAAAFALLLAEGFTGAPAAGVAPPPDGSGGGGGGGGGAPATVLASAASESASLALVKLVFAVGAPLYGEARTLPRRVHFAGTHHYAVENLMDAFVAASVPSWGGAGGAEAAAAAARAVAAPLVERLVGLCGGSGGGGGAGGALRLCAADGTIAAALTSEDGVVKACHTAALGLDAGGAGRLWAWAEAHGGSVADCAAVALRPERALHACVAGLLRKVQHAVKAFSGASGGGGERGFDERWPAFAPEGFAAAWGGWSREERDAHRGIYAAAEGAAEAATAAGVGALFALAWPALQAVLASWGSGAVPALEAGGGGGAAAPQPASGAAAALPVDACLSLVSDVWECLQLGLRKVGPPLYPYARVWCEYLAAAFSAPPLGAQPRLLGAAARAVWLLGACPGVVAAPGLAGAGGEAPPA